MLAELGIVLTDPGHCLADGAGHTDSSPLGRGRGSSIATTQADRTRELSNQEVAFGVRLRGPLGVPEDACLLNVVLDLGEASTVRVLGSHVEELARITERPGRQAGRLTALDGGDMARLGGDEVEYVELPAGRSEQPREVAHALEVSHADRAPFEHDRPVIPLATKYVGGCSRPLVLELQGGLLLVAAGMEGFGEAHACDRRLIGRSDLVPESRSFRAQPLPVRRIALGESHPSLGKGRAGDQRLALESGGHPLQLLGG